MFQTVRHSSQRFPLSSPLGSQLQNARQTYPGDRWKSQTLHLSSSGVWFLCKKEVPLGTRLELLIRWPVQRNEDIPLVLVILGRVTGNTSPQLSVAIEKYKFQVANTRAEPTSPSTTVL